MNHNVQMFFHATYGLRDRNFICFCFIMIMMIFMIMSLLILQQLFVFSLSLFFFSAATEMDWKVIRF